MSDEYVQVGNDLVSMLRCVLDGYAAAAERENSTAVEVPTVDLEISNVIALLSRSWTDAADGDHMHGRSRLQNREAGAACCLLAIGICDEDVSCSCGCIQGNGDAGHNLRGRSSTVRVDCNPCSTKGDSGSGLEVAAVDCEVGDGLALVPR